MLSIKVLRWSDPRKEARVSLVRVLMEYRPCSLSQARVMMEDLIAGGSITVSIPLERADAFLDALRALGLQAVVTVEDMRGLELDWLASDEDGHVALFTTAGGGFVPREVVSVEEQDAAIDALLASAATTTALYAPQIAPDLANTWRLAAERGLFAFDSDSFGGPYRLVAAPAEPACLGDTHQNVSEVAGRCRLSRLCFCGLSLVDRDWLTVHVRTGRGL